MPRPPPPSLDLPIYPARCCVLLRARRAYLLAVSDRGQIRRVHEADLGGDSSSLAEFARLGAEMRACPQFHADYPREGS